MFKPMTLATLGGRGGGGELPVGLGGHRLDGRGKRSFDRGRSRGPRCQPREPKTSHTGARSAHPVIVRTAAIRSPVESSYPAVACRYG